MAGLLVLGVAFQCGVLVRERQQRVGVCIEDICDIQQVCVVGGIHGLQEATASGGLV